MTDMSVGVQARVTSLFVKRAHGAPMSQVGQLSFSSAEGVRGDINPAGFSPRQVCVALGSSLGEHDVKPAGARANIVVEGVGATAISSGTLLTCGTVTLRVTMKCEPCAHGARMAGTQMARFRNLTRYLAVVRTGGTMSELDYVSVQPGRFAAVADGFAERCAWVLEKIPPGHLVTSLELLNAIGASKSYARVLPRWLAMASAIDKPVHRVLTANLTAPSWAPNAVELLTEEGVDPFQIRHACYPLTKSVWFS